MFLIQDQKGFHSASSALDPYLLSSALEILVLKSMGMMLGYPPTAFGLSHIIRVFSDLRTTALIPHTNCGY